MFPWHDRINPGNTHPEVPIIKSQNTVIKQADARETRPEVCQMKSYDNLMMKAADASKANKSKAGLPRLFYGPTRTFA